MRYRTLGAGLASAVTVLVVVVAGAPLTAANHGPHTLRFGVQFHDDILDLGAEGPTAGDEQILHDTLVNSHGRVVGHDGGVCVFTDLNAPETHCVVTFSLPKGQITTQFLNTPPPNKVAAITGGTGAYRDARGVMLLTEHPDQTGDLVFQLDR